MQLNNSRIINITNNFLFLGNFLVKRLRPHQLKTNLSNNNNKNNTVKYTYANIQGVSQNF